MKMKRVLVLVVTLFIVSQADSQPITPQVLAPASTATGAGLNIAPGVAPSSPNNGDTWTTATGIFVRINGGTVGPLGTVSSPTLSNPTFTGTVTFPDNATWSSSGLLSGTSLVVGSASALNLNGLTPKVQVAGATNTAAAIGNSEWSNDGSVPTYSFYKSRGTSIGTLGITQSGDNLGIIKGVTDDGSTAGGINAAQIAFVNDAVPTAGNAYGRISFYTRNATTVTEQMRLDRLGDVLVTTGPLTVNSTPLSWSSSVAPIQLGNAGALYGSGTQATVSENVYTNASGQVTYINSAAAAQISVSSGLIGLATAPSGTAGNAATFTNQILISNTGGISMPGVVSTTGAQTGTMCWAAAAISYDPSLGCLSSLEELKNIHGQIAGTTALSETMQLSPFWFSWKPSTPEYIGDKHEQLGLGAHATEKVDTRLVGYSTDGKLRGVRYEELTALLVADIKEQQSEISELRREIAVVSSGHGVPSAANDNFFSRVRYVMGW